MGFFKKIFKGVGKVFKKIGKVVKNAFVKFGKFMGKAGLLGQVAMAFILPGIRNALASGIGSALGLSGVTGMSTLVGSASAGTGLLGSGSAFLQGAGKVLQFAGKVASAPGKIFSSITKGVTSTLTEFSKTALSKMGFEGKLVEGAAENYFFGADSAASRVGTAIKSPFTEKALLDAVTETADDFQTNLIEGGKSPIEALEDRWLGTVSVMILNPADKTQFGKLSEYNGQVSRGSWDDTRLNLVFNTVIDAVAGEVPQRRLSKRLVGDLPISSNVRLQ